MEERRTIDTEEQPSFLRGLTMLLVVLLVFSGALVLPLNTFAAESASESTDSADETERNVSKVARIEIITDTITVTDVSSYDIWKHINGTWQFGKKKGSAVTASFEISISGKLPEGAKVTAVNGRFHDTYSGTFSEWTVPSANIGVQSFTNTIIKYSMNTTLNGTPLDVRQDTQSEYTEGYRYYIPAIFEVTYTLEKEVLEEVIPPPVEVTPEEEEVPSASMAGEAILEIPQVTYEGHAIEATDSSVFEVDNETYSAARMYDEGLASNSFTASDKGRVKRKSKTAAEITFNKSGRQNVVLKVETDSGDILTDKKYIELLETPAIVETLGGVQKENRRQVLTILVAQHPSYPLSELWVEIEQKGGAQQVHLEHDTSIAGGSGTGSNQNDNSELIKTRPIKDIGSDSRFTRVELEFLTKNDQKIQMTYRIYAKDTRGNTAIAEEDFEVVPDIAPEVVIAADNPQFRDEGSNIAYVYAEDTTLYDGDDADRIWYVRTEETDWTEASASGGLLMDASFGTWRAVAYKKTGVGKVEFRLDVRDRWTEATLEEYVSESDRLTGSGTVQTEVENIAPRVSLTAEKMKKGNLLMLALNDEEEENFASNANTLRQNLFEQGMSTEVHTNRVKTQEELNTSDSPDEVLELVRPYGYGLENTFLEKGWYLCDADTLYTVDGTWSQDTENASVYWYDADAPYTISAYDLRAVSANGTEPKWKITISADRIDNAKIAQIKGIAQDDTGTYLYFITETKTLIYDKESGAFVADISFVFGSDNFVSKWRIFTLKSDGMYSVNMRTGKINKIYAGNIITKDSYSDPEGSAKRINSEIHFVAGNGTEIMRAALDPNTEELRLTAIRPTGATYASTYNISGFASNGDVCIARDNKSAVHVFDRDGNELMKKSGWSVDKEHDILPVYKNDGNFDYVLVLYNTYERTGTQAKGYKYKYTITETLYDISGKKEPLTYTNERVTSASEASGNGTDAGKAMYAVQIGNQVVVNTGNWSSCISDGTPISSYYNTSFVQIVFDTEARTAKRYTAGSTAYSQFNAGGVLCEYGKFTDEYVVSAYSNVAARYAYGEGSNEQMVKVARMPKTADIEIAMSVDKFAPIKKRSDIDSAAVFIRSSVGELAMDRINMAENTLISDDEMTIAQQMIATAGDARGIKVNSDKSSISTITKTYNLLPNTEYFYEMNYEGELDEPVTVEMVLDGSESLSSSLTGNSYRVAEVQSEDFYDASDTNSYFAGLSEGRISEDRYYGAALNLTTDTSGGNRVVSDNSSITFTIESGRSAIVTFDYKMRANQSFVDEAFVNIDGERWYRNSSFSKSSGIYTHPHILTEGEHTISFGAKGYGKRPIQTYISIDNIKVIYIEKSTEAISEIKKETGASKGSFVTPQNITSYAGQAITYINEKPLDGTADLIERTDTSNTKGLLITIPEDQKAVFTAVNLTSSPVENRSVAWTFEDKTVYVRTEATANYYPMTVPNPLRMTTDKHEGTITVSTGTLRRTSADFINLEMALTDTLNDSIINGKYCLSPDKNELLFEDKVFNGKINFGISGQGEWSVRDFKLYYIEDGRRVYVEDGYIEADDAASFSVSGGEIAIEKMNGQTQQPNTIPVYKKGETVKHEASYYDYEGDPSKKQYWRYTHIEGNDGVHPDAGKVLDAPIEEFYIDGRYTVEHWQEDSTGSVGYDKHSNTANLTFYIEGTANTPWIESIKTNPHKVGEGDEFGFVICVNDHEKDILNLTTEVYFQGKLIYTHKKDDIAAGANGKYPAVYTDILTGGAKEGEYSVVCTVRDELGMGLGTYSFKVEKTRKIEGDVRHFSAWEEKRIRYNEQNPGSPRSKNTFWAQEAFDLMANVKGEPLSVKVTSKEYPYKTVTLSKQSSGIAADESIYTGTFFDSKIAAELAREGNCDITFIFTAMYTDNTAITDEVTVIIDDTGGSNMQIHRVW